MTTQDVKVVPTEQTRTLRAITFVDLWNLLRGAKGALGPAAPTFDWLPFVSSLRSDASSAMSPTLSYSKIDRIHLLTEGVYIYGAPTRFSDGVGSSSWLHDLASTAGFTVKQETTKAEKYKCNTCGGRIKIHRESGSDAHLISDLMWLAWQDRYDVAIVVSGDKDLLPSIERIQLSGRKVVAALFDGTSQPTRRTAHATVSLDKILLQPHLYGGYDKGLGGIYHKLPHPLRGEETVRLILKHGLEPDRLREILLAEVDKLAGVVEDWFRPDRRSPDPADIQLETVMIEYRETIEGLLGNPQT